MASECAPPAATTDHDAPAGPETSIGNDVVTVEFVPSWPLEFKPQPYNTPVVLIARLWKPPPDATDHDALTGP